MESVRPPAVAGAFYEGGRENLMRTVTELLDEAGRQVHVRPGPPPKALIVPHAGYVYSGPVAASAYVLLGKARGLVTRVILLGPAHRVYLRGLALPEARAFRTPLGEVPVDREGVLRLSGMPQVSVNGEAHRLEHALEVQLPFLQVLLGDFTLLPLVVGQASPEEVEEVLAAVRGGPETLIVVSSDLSHYLKSSLAREIDARTARTILDLDPELVPEEACGAFPVNGLLLAARKWHLQPFEVDLRNSGDTAGTPDQVVGYGSFAFFEKSSASESRAEEEAIDGSRLVDLARESVETTLGHGMLSRPSGPPWLFRPGATFVTLTKHGQLRGCIGSLEAWRPLIEDLRTNAQAAAFHDPRFPPVVRGELDRLRFEVSLLSPPSPLPVSGEGDLLEQLRPGTDGLILSLGRARGTFLPQVWEQLPEPEEFVGHLKEKAGLPRDFWSEGLRFWRYSVSHWKEDER